MLRGAYDGVRLLAKPAPDPTFKPFQADTAFVTCHKPHSIGKLSLSLDIVTFK